MKIRNVKLFGDHAALRRIPDKRESSIG